MKAIRFIMGVCIGISGGLLAMQSLAQEHATETYAYHSRRQDIKHRLEKLARQAASSETNKENIALIVELSRLDSLIGSASGMNPLNAVRPTAVPLLSASLQGTLTAAPTAPVINDPVLKKLMAKKVKTEAKFRSVFLLMASSLSLMALSWKFNCQLANQCRYGFMTATGFIGAHLLSLYRKKATLQTLLKSQGLDPLKKESC